MYKPFLSSAEHLFLAGWGLHKELEVDKTNDICVLTTYPVAA